MQKKTKVILIVLIVILALVIAQFILSSNGINIFSQPPEAAVRVEVTG
ncbi:MAG TPA: hypothetical protein VJJ21_00025 [Candidatus Nanoarchaeia archaeon]|nr:hypothetical protein [Candidatus Nanoarchaeia archaeon]